MCIRCKFIENEGGSTSGELNPPTTIDLFDKNNKWKFNKHILTKNEKELFSWTGDSVEKKPKEWYDLQEKLLGLYTESQ